MTSPERRPALTLRPYQEEAITAVGRALERGVRRPLMSFPPARARPRCSPP